MAYRSGKLTGRDQSLIQRWALGYHQFSENRKKSDRSFEIERLLHFILRASSEKLYMLAFPRVESDDPDVIPGHTYGVEDLEGLEKLIKSFDRMQRKSQAELGGNEWTDWR